MLRRRVNQLQLRRKNRQRVASGHAANGGPVEHRPFVVASSMSDLCKALRNEARSGQYSLMDQLIKFVVEQEQFHARS